MRIYKSLLLVACSLCLSVRLAGQAAAGYGTATAAGTTGAAASGKGISKSIGGAFDSLNKKQGKGTGEQATAESSKAPPASRKGAPPKVVTLPAAALPAKAEPVRLVTASEIKIGTPRADIVREFGQPSAMTSQTDEAGFVQTYIYKGVDEPVVVTFREGKVVRISPPPDAKPNTPDPLPRRSEPEFSSWRPGRRQYTPKDPYCGHISRAAQRRRPVCYVPHCSIQHVEAGLDETT